MFFSGWSFKRCWNLKRSIKLTKCFTCLINSVSPKILESLAKLSNILGFTDIWSLCLFTFSIISFNRSSHRMCSVRKRVLKIFTKFTGKYLCQSLFAETCIFVKKETLAHVFSCEFCETLKNTFFTEHLWVAGSDSIQLSYDLSE